MRTLFFALLVLTIIGSCKKDETAPTIVYQDDLTVNKNTWTSDSTKVHVKMFYGGHYLFRVDSVPNYVFR